MKKILSLSLSSISLLLIILAGCQTGTTVNPGLSAEKTVFAKKTGNQWQIVEGNTFQKGDIIGLVFINVSGFKKGEDGLNRMDLDVEVKDADGNVILKQEGLLGESGHIDLADNIAESPVGIFRTDGSASGEYTITVTIHDMIGGGKITAGRNFTIK